MTATQNGQPPIRVGVGVHDALTARIAEQVGYDFTWLGSLEVSARLAVPDANVLTFTEMAAVVAEVRAACRLPVYVDADNGYGSNQTAVRAARLFERAGAAVMCLEDNAFPKRNSLIVGHRELVDRDEFAARLGAVCEARDSMRVIARTEALVAGASVDEAGDRLRAYAKAGVDALFVQVNSASRHLLAPVLDDIGGVLPVVLAPTALPGLTVADFGRMGAAEVIFANVVVRTILASLRHTLATVRRSGRLADVSDDIAGVDEVFELIADRG